MRLRVGAEIAHVQLPRIEPENGPGNTDLLPVHYNIRPDQWLAGNEDLMSEELDHDTWLYGPPKAPRASELKFKPLRDVLPFDGVRNPTSRSSISHRIAFTYHTAANNYRPRLGLAESAAEEAVAYEALLSPNLYDLRMQPVTITYDHPDGGKRKHTFDLGLVHVSGHQRLVFVRNGHSLAKPEVQREIAAIQAAIPKSVAHDMIVVNADTYTRQRRENLHRMYRASRAPDPGADEMVLDVVSQLPGQVLLRDLVRKVDLPSPRVMQTVWRLLGQRRIAANLDHVISLQSLVGARVSP